MVPITITEKRPPRKSRGGHWVVIGGEDWATLPIAARKCFQELVDDAEDLLAVEEAMGSKDQSSYTLDEVQKSLQCIYKSKRKRAKHSKK